ncbi:MAG: hypothetical protein RQ741_12175 [Wenzhouxiangellaceae bacterium]|nr:hypothetical protein [Wenzhouxiangellaceae bacterium]
MQRSIKKTGSILVAVLLLASHPVLSQLADPAQGEAQASAKPEAQPGAATPAAELARWFAMAAEAYDDQDHQRWAEALENLHRLRPFNYDFMRQLVMAYALTDQTSKAFNIMLKMQQQGLSVDWDQVEEVESLRAYPLYQHLNDLMVGAGEPGGSARILWDIDGQYPMPEALAHDPKTGRVFVGTVRDGLVLVRGPESDQFEVFASPDDTPGLNAVFDLLVDQQRGHLWIATASTSHYRHSRQADFGRTALLKLDLESGEKLGEYRVLPDRTPHLLGAMDLASDGTIYAADGLTPVIYKLAPGDERPKAFVGNPLFASLRGIALSADESRLYVVDYDMGVFFFELETGSGFALGIPETLNLGGIDGLYQWKDSLVVIQNGVTPQRVLRLDLDPSGTRVASVASLVVAQPAFDSPTFGTMAGDDLIFLAANHWNRVDNNGRPATRPLPDIPVMRAAVDKAQNVMVGEQALEELKRASGHQN